MADSKDTGHEIIRSAIEGLTVASFDGDRELTVKAQLTAVAVTDMTPTAADALKEVARYTHAVPAEQETARAVQVSRRTYAAYLLTLIFAGGMLVDVSLAPYFASMAAGVLGVKALTDYLEKKGKPKKDE